MGCTKIWSSVVSVIGERGDHLVDCLCHRRSADDAEYGIVSSGLGTARGAVLAPRTAAHDDPFRTPGRSGDSGQHPGGVRAPIANRESDLRQDAPIAQQGRQRFQRFRLRFEGDEPEAAGLETHGAR